MKSKYSTLKIVTYVVILVLVLVMAIPSTFSWYNREQNEPAESYLLEYKQTGKVTANGTKTIETYVGEVVNGMLTYETKISDDSRTVATKTKEVTYFKTVITDSANAGDTVLSLYVNDITYLKTMGQGGHIGLVEPEKTYKAFNAAESDGAYKVSNLCIEDNIIVANNGSVEIYWFVEFDADYISAGEVTLGELYVVYN